jgi:hypothetical protein
VRGERQDRGDGHRRAGAARRGQGQASPPRAPRPVLAGAIGGDGAEPEGVQRPLRRALGGDGAEQPAARVGGLGGVPELHGQHGVVPRQGAVPERAPPAHRRAGAAVEPEEGDPTEGRQDAAVLVGGRRGAARGRPVVAVVGGPEAGRVERVAQGQRVRVHQLRAHRGHRVQPDTVARRLRGENKIARFPSRSARVDHHRSCHVILTEPSSLCSFSRCDVACTELSLSLVCAMEGWLQEFRSSNDPGCLLGSSKQTLVISLQLLSSVCQESNERGWFRAVHSKISNCIFL